MWRRAPFSRSAPRVLGMELVRLTITHTLSDDGDEQIARMRQHGE